MDRLRAPIRAALAVGGLLLAGSPALAQNPFGEVSIDRWGPVLDSITAGVGNRAIWRGFELGGRGVEAGVDVAIWGSTVTETGDWGVSLLAAGLLVPDPHPGAVIEDRVGLGLDVVRGLDALGATLHLVAEGYHLPDAADDATGVELGLRLRGVEIPWSGEVRPTLEFAVLHDPVHFEGTHAEAAFGYVFGLGRVGLWLDARGWWNDYGDSDFHVQGWRAGAGVAADAFQAGERWIAVSVGGGAVEPKASPVLGWGEIRLKLR